MHEDAARLAAADQHYAAIQRDIDELIEAHTYDDYDVVRIATIARELQANLGADGLAVTLAIAIARLVEHNRKAVG